MTIDLHLPEKQSLKPTITVFGVGGAGGNAVNNMISMNLEGVNFVVANTDAQSLEESKCKNHIQLGESITQGLGAGSYPEVGKASAEEAVDEVMDYLQGSNMVFITAGLGGGTGTGAAPVVARLAREQGILTVAVVTKPFHFEGTHRMRVAELGLQELQKYVDTIIVIPNQNLFRVADKSTTFLDAFKLADDVLHSGVRGITDLMVMPGLINLDFSDVRSVMSEMGKAMMGTGQAEGENRAVGAAEAAIANPLLDNVSMKGARGVLINITGGSDMTLFEVDEAANRIREEVDPDANIIFGSAYDKDLEGTIRVSVVATGIENDDMQTETAEYVARKKESVMSSLGLKPQPSEVSVSNDGKAKLAEAAASSIKEEIDTGRKTAGDMFISPEPVEPKFYDDESLLKEKIAQKIEQAAKPEAQTKASAENDPVKRLFGDIGKEEPKTQSGKLFGSLFGGGKKESAPAEKQKEEVREKATVSADAAVSSSPSQKKESLNIEDDLDIPAFLRRKSE